MAKQSPRLGWFQLIAIALILVLGMGFRLHGLDHKVYWHDEVLTSLRTVGYNAWEAEQQILEQSSQQTMTAADLQQFQQLSPAKTWTDTWASLKTRPEHPPLFYLLERAWMEVAGSSITATRGLSALFGIALFPLMAWFCNGLVRWLEPTYNQPIANQPTATSEHQVLRTSAWGRQTAAIAIALLAVSPVQILYAQEARAYSLWACTIILASGLFLRALSMDQRSGKALIAWLAYAGAIALGFYTALFTVLVVVAHGAYLLLLMWLPSSESGQPFKGRLLHWIGAVAAALLLFSPWLLIMVQARQAFSDSVAWTSAPIPLNHLMSAWGRHLSRSLIDLGRLDAFYSLTTTAAAALLVLLSWLAIPNFRLRGFLASMLLLPALMLILPDLIQGGQRSNVTRYFLPLLLSVTVTVALGIAQGLRSPQRLSRLACQLLVVGLLITGTLSSYRSAMALSWWNKEFQPVLPAMGDYITQAQEEQPTPVWLDLGGTGLGDAIALSYRLPPETLFYFSKLPDLREASNLPISPGERVLLPYASGELIEALEQTEGETLASVEVPGVRELWQLKVRHNESKSSVQ